MSNFAPKSKNKLIMKKRTDNESDMALLEKLLRMARGLRGTQPKDDEPEESEAEGTEEVPSPDAGEQKESEAEKSDATEKSVSAERKYEKDENPEKGDGKKQEKCCGIPMVVKHNIVESIADIRQFAEEHQLAMSAIEKLVQILLEISLGCVKGRVTREMLQWVLRILRYDTDREEAARLGEIKGRNEAIAEKFFPSGDDGIPHLSGGKPSSSADSSIFDLARKAK